MEPSAIGRDLDDLEGRIERLRALYEQYFMGIERLEPQIQRKDVERRIQLLRKEQIRNTGLRFKFQMLIQRYNTLQQYWGRVTREIENGTYRRDVMRAAVRFGAKEALTIVGKRRAQQYAALADAQEKLKPRAGQALEEDEVEIKSEDLIDDGGARSRSAARMPDDPSDLLPLVTSNATPLPRAAPPLPSASPSRAAPLLPPAASLLRAAPPLAVAPLPPVASAPPAPATVGGRPLGASPDLTSSLSLPPGAVLDAQRSAPSAPASTAAAADAKGAVRVTEDASAAPGRSGVKRRVAELVAAMRPSPAQSGAGEARQSGALDLDLDEGAPPRPAERASSALAAPRAAASAAAAAREGSLPEQRLRQIYAKYVETKRQVKESTAGLTYDKLAETLRAQAQRLHASHPTKTVDYEVVIKDGKTHIKPTLK
jgi:hypothetical protein